MERPEDLHWSGSSSICLEVCGNIQWIPDVSKHSQEEFLDSLAGSSVLLQDNMGSLHRSGDPV